MSGVWIKALTGSNGAAALVSVFSYAPSLLGPVGGVIADRVRRRMLLLIVNGLRLTIQEGGKLVAPLLGAALFAVLGGAPVAALDAVTFLIAFLVIIRLRVVEPHLAPARRPGAPS